MKMFISGPMSGIKDHNFPLFFEAEEAVKDKWDSEGLDRVEFVNPARLGENDGWEWKDYLVRDIVEMLSCNAILLLHNWEQSRGARLEQRIAEDLGFTQYLYWNDGMITEKAVTEPVKESALQEAQRLVYGDRGKDYGHPFVDYTKTARLWSIILGTDVTCEQAILCMVAVKISREIHNPKRDNRVDMAGYAECLERVRILSPEEREKMLETL